MESQGGNPCPNCNAPTFAGDTFCTRCGATLGHAAPASGPQSAETGRVVGSYKILRLLGEGGMGSVFLAEHVRLGRKVAVKMLHPRFSGHPEAVKRFFAEAHTVNQISHENLVEITDFIDGDGGVSCYIMELLQGGDLAALLAREPQLSPERFLPITIQLASVLGAVHAAGVVHRDVKPDNVFLTNRHGKTDFVKLLDFGVAKLSQDDSDRLSVNQTAAGQVLGTPSYMAPEQARGAAIDARADIYAFGVMLFELATGQKPFRGETFGELLVAHMMNAPPRPRDIAPHVSKALEELILRCLAKEPAERPQTMAEVEAALRALEAKPVSAEPAPRLAAGSVLEEPTGGGRIVGIDLGTTNSCVAVLDRDHPVIIPNKEGERTTPSMVSWQDDGKIVVGASSKRQMTTNPRRTLFGVKRLMGRKLDNPTAKALIRNLPYSVVAGPNGDARIKIDDATYSPQEVSAHILAKLVEAAEAHLGESIKEAVITVPAYFDDAQRQATKLAGLIAGIKVRAILNEATAAALAYGFRATDKNQTIAVFDLGGGTFDVSIVAVRNGVFDVLSTSGDTNLGGEDIDFCMLNLVADKFERMRRIDLREDPVALQRLKEASVQAKVELSQATTTEINLPYLGTSGKTPLHLTMTISRDELEKACAPILKRLEQPCRQALEAAGLTTAQLDHVVLVGGMTRMPAVEREATRIFGKPPVKGVNPDEAVAIGAAIKASMLAGTLQEVSLLDVTPYPLGIRVAGDKMSVLIPANSKLPITAHKLFSTTDPDQEYVAVQVYQGDSAAASNNRYLGGFRFGGLRGGQAHLRVSFTVDVDGVLAVSAKDTRFGREVSGTIEGASGLSAAELERVERLR